MSEQTRVSHPIYNLPHFGQMRTATDGGDHVFEVQVYLNGLDPDTVRVELYADGVDGGGPVRQEMKPVHEQDGTSDCHAFIGSVSASRPHADYTVRVMPRRDGIAVPLEASEILWQR